MDSSVPSTPDQLFDMVGEPTLRSIFPNYDRLPPLLQKLVRLVHTELVTGNLTDVDMKALCMLSLSIWRSLAVLQIDTLDDMLFGEPPDNEGATLTNYTDAIRLEQTLTSTIACLSVAPVTETQDDPMAPTPVSYRLASDDAFNG